MEGSRRYFPGANSARGFYSLYDQMMIPGTDRVYIIKGGPGTGKSTFMKATGRDMEAEGLKLEYHYCSSDPCSLDGLVIPALGTVLLDGTSPHAVDPRYPGAVEAIINLGECWQEKFLRERKLRILQLVDEIKRLFGQAYGMLSLAAKHLSLTEDCYEIENLHYNVYMEQCARGLIEEIFPAALKPKSTGSRQRKLFLTSITSQGSVSFLHDLKECFSHIIVLRGDDRKGKGKILARLAEAATVLGYRSEIFCCSLNPHRVDHLALPELDCAVLNSAEPHYVNPDGYAKAIATGNDFFTLSGKLRGEKEDLLTRYRDTYARAISYLEKARLLHEELESYYIPAMNFEAVEKCRQKVVGEILSSPQK